MPGELVWAQCNKLRPVVLTGQDFHGLWRAMSLTSQRYHKNGNLRVAVPNPGRVGLKGAQQYLHSDRLDRIASEDLGVHIGYADTALIEAIIDLTGLQSEYAGRLRRSASDRHRAASTPDGGR